MARVVLTDIAIPWVARPSTAQSCAADSECRQALGQTCAGQCVCAQSRRKGAQGTPCVYHGECRLGYCNGQGICDTPGPNSCDLDEGFVYAKLKSASGEVALCRAPIEGCCTADAHCDTWLWCDDSTFMCSPSEPQCTAGPLNARLLGDNEQCSSHSDRGHGYCHPHSDSVDKSGRCTEPWIGPLASLLSVTAPPTKTVHAPGRVVSGEKGGCTGNPGCACRLSCTVQSAVHTWRICKYVYVVA